MALKYYILEFLHTWSHDDPCCQLSCYYYAHSKNLDRDILRVHQEHEFFQMDPR